MLSVDGSRDDTEAIHRQRVLSAMVVPARWVFGIANLPSLVDLDMSTLEDHILLTHDSGFMHIIP